jgi:hypothetical protein
MAMEYGGAGGIMKESQVMITVFLKNVPKISKKSLIIMGEVMTGMDLFMQTCIFTT